MKTVSTLEEFQQQQRSGALLALFGGPHCGVCQALKPKLSELVASRFPEIVLLYVDCEQSREICAQQGVFSLPVVKLFIEGQMHLELAGSFSLQALASRIERAYGLWITLRQGGNPPGQ
ncbi:thioredoxin family protein [Sedimenticola thiotaurini]|uniref:Thioredoxin domain-containing protein n=1 Tax=Sedimenticola thiotaurini TaxID=1543721 RepID=A0A0F7K1W6_9GAMM|nr:thioredoxin family protein [Sedimenticola thiotaurini]AKH21165.1 hypothetical protein AAY24_13260 [Sedimenticola thiotaurini]